MGIGSELRADDAAGLSVAVRMEKILKDNPNIKAYCGGVNPENLTGEIKKFNPSHIIIIDSADFGEKPGEVKIIQQQDIRGASFSTHQLPLKFLIDYLKESLACEIVLIGIQPKTISFGEMPSEEIALAIDMLSKMLKELLLNL